MTLDDVRDIETLRKAAKLLDAEVQTLSKLVVKLKRELFELKHGKAQQLELKLQIKELEEQLARRNKLLFGESSEKRPTSSAKKERTEKQAGHGRREQPELEVVEQIHVAQVEDETCELCGGHLHASEGFFEESEEVDVIERRFVIKRHRRQKYKCSCGSCIKAAPAPLKLFPGARYSTGFAAHVAIAKYADHLPLERQVRSMQRDDLTIDSQTLWDQLNVLGRLLEPAYQRLKSHVLTEAVIGVDETHWKVMGEKGKEQGGKGKRPTVVRTSSHESVDLDEFARVRTSRWTWTSSHEFARVGGLGRGLGRAELEMMDRGPKMQRRAPRAFQGQQAEFQPTPTSRFLHPSCLPTRLRAACSPPE